MSPNDANVEIETQPLTEEMERSNLKSYTCFYVFLSSNYYVLLLLKYNFKFHLYF